MLDRVREALFGTLGERVEAARVLDLFAGSGSLGIEALSRGAVLVRFVEDAPAALAALRAILDALGIAEGAEVVRGDALDPARFDGEAPWDIVLLDPPYGILSGSGARRALFAAVDELARARLAETGVLVLHTPDHGVVERDFGAGLTARQRIYGRSALWYVERAPAAGAPTEERP
jgi:16S rRNA (guanine966-N2)-methyltransferase